MRRLAAAPSMQAAALELHAHTTASDGVLTPPELVEEALERGLRLLAVTDHDTVAGVEPARERAAGSTLTILPGIELNTSAGETEVHVLGYELDHQRDDLAAFLQAQRLGRSRRAQEMVERLQRLGLPIRYEQVLAQANGAAVGRPHLARALAAAGLVREPQEAFQRWIGLGKPAYVPRTWLTPEGAVQRIIQFGGVPVLAHPANMLDLEAWVRRLHAAGLAGLECYYGGYAPAVRQALLALARRYDLVPTGGSDYHGPGQPGRVPLGSIWVPPETPERLRARRPVGLARKERQEVPGTAVPGTRV